MPIKERSGIVVSNKMEKTIVVSIENRITHKKYGKVIAKTKKYKVHDEENQCQIGNILLKCFGGIFCHIKWYDI